MTDIDRDLLWDRESVFEVSRALRGEILETPVRPLPWLSRVVGVPVWAKLEHQQFTGSFKARGAANAFRCIAGERNVVTASAGNHGLAMAETARRVGRQVTVFMPTNASRLKRERILSTGAATVEAGTSLEIAIRAAREFANEHEAVFVSPYDDKRVILGNSTLAVELVQQVGALSTIVVPVGGGGLISGIGLALRALHSPSRLVGCEPAAYPSLSVSLHAGAPTRVVHQPTLADGLAVNLDQNALTFSLCRELVHEVVTLSEEELAAGTLALLVHESLLVEPSGAAGVAGVLRLAREGRLTGPVAIPLCGGNIHHTTLARVERFPYKDEDLIRLLDLRGRKTTELRVPHGSSAPVNDVELEETGPEHLVSRQLADCRHGLDEALGELRDWRLYCEGAALTISPEICDELVRTGQRAVALLSGVGVDATPAGLARAEASVRWARGTIAHLRGSINWCSASYDQSCAVQFLDLGAQESPTVNYERYECAAVRRVENQLLDVLALPADRMAVSATSSGMAAFTLVESLLLRRPRPSDKILLAPYIYFEVEEQLRALHGLSVVRSQAFEAEALAEEAERVAPFALFVDPLANHALQRMTDLRALLSALRKRGVTTTVVIDGTMVSGATSADILDSSGGVEVIYYESGSKYLQLGFDASMAGFVAYPVEIMGLVERLRRNTGTIMTRHGAELFPRYKRADFLARMTRISRNAALVAQQLASDLRVTSVCSVIHPSLPTHPDHTVAALLPFTGGCVTFLLREVGLNHRDQLEALIDDVLAPARQLGLHLTKGVSFGFGAPRLSAAASMAESEPAFLRLYVGDRGREQASLLGSLVARAIERLT